MGQILTFAPGLPPLAPLFFPSSAQLRNPLLPRCLHVFRRGDYGGSMGEGAWIKAFRGVKKCGFV